MLHIEGKRDRIAELTSSRRLVTRSVAFVENDLKQPCLQNNPHNNAQDKNELFCN